MRKPPEVVFEAPEWKIRRLAELRAQVTAAISPEAASWAQFRTPGDLAKAIDPATVQTSALDIVDQALVEVADGRCERLILSMPPQEGKSERVTHYGVLYLLLRDPTRRIGLVSFQADVAARLSSLPRRDIVTYQGGDDTIDLGLRLRRDSNAVSHWSLDGHRGGVYAIGIAGALTSVPVDLLVVDDPVKDYRAADSQLQSDQTWEWWQSTARTRLSPGGPVILIMTRWHENDLAGRLLAKQREDEAAGLPNFDRWRVINIPAQAEHRPEQGETDPLGREPGEFMLSARGRTRAQWEATKAASGARIWTALYQGRPSPETGDLFKRDAWGRFDLATKVALQEDGTMRCPGADQVVQSWDMAFKDRKSSDFVVGQVWARFGNQVYLLDQVHERLSFTATCAAVVELANRWPQATAKLVEDKANGTAVIDQLRFSVSGLIPVNPGSDSKYVRALAVTPFVEARQVWVPAGPGWADAFVEEHAVFPNGRHDDQVDAMTQGVSRLLGGGRGPVSVASPAGMLGSMKMPAVPLALPR